MAELWPSDKSDQIGNITFDDRHFQAALNQVILNTKKTIPEVLNQRMLNIMGRSVRNMPPASVDANKARVKAYLGEVLAQKVKLRSRPYKGMSFRAMGKKQTQLRRVNLIINRIRGKHGLPGLQGKDMAAAAARFMSAKQRAVGYLKSLFIPAIRILNPLSLFKVPYSDTGGSGVVKRPDGVSWSKSEVHPAKNGWSPLCTVRILYGVRRGQKSKVQNIVDKTVHKAFLSEQIEMERHVREKLQRHFDEVMVK